MMLDLRHELHICNKEYILFCASDKRLTRTTVTVEDITNQCPVCKRKYQYGDVRID